MRHLVSKIDLDPSRGQMAAPVAEVHVSRLDSFIRRLEAQRACIDHACTLIADVAGPVLELGLGNGRTYDHLRERLPEREIFVFDRQVAAHPLSRPDDLHLVQGDVRETLPAAAGWLPARAALVHSDVGTGEAHQNARLAARIAGVLPDLLAARAVVISDQQLPDPRLVPLPLPDGVAEGRYFLYRAVLD
jgi:hypothetical protein